MATEREWFDVDLEDLSNESAKALKEWTAARELEKSKRAAFAKALAKDVPPPSGMAYLVGAKWGKVSASMVAAKDAPKPKARKLTLAEYLAQQR